MTDETRLLWVILFVGWGIVSAVLSIKATLKDKTVFAEGYQVIATISMSLAVLLIIGR